MYKSKYTGEQINNLLGEVFDSTLQTKDVEITEGGLTEITPDDGYLGLAKVNVNVSAGQGGSGGGASIEYFDISSEEHRALVEIAISAAIVKLKDDINTKIAPPMMILMSGNELSMEKLMQVTAFAIDIDILLKGLSNAKDVTIRDLYGAYLENVPRLTKEEFYDLNA